MQANKNNMTPPELIPLALDDTFTFGCHPNVPCFNHCCRDLNQALTPYDVLQLKRHMGLSAQEFLDRFAILYMGPATGLPVVSLRFAQAGKGACPFVTDSGCQVYSARPASCRIYPLARALHRSRSDGRISEHYALLQESHCRGFEQVQTQTVRQWIAGQGLKAYHQMNDALLELIALKNQMRPGELSPEHRQLTQMAFYNLDTLKQKASAKALPGMDHDHLPPLPDPDDDDAWLTWSMAWIRQVLFGKESSK
jgi:uncharacterized protein